MNKKKIFKDGWRNEHFAKYILSNFCFVSEPSTVSDDIGIDLFCTAFKIDEKFNHLYPECNFSIQIKSSADAIDITDKTLLFDKLEIPYFIGVVDKDKTKLTIYSGESIPHFISYYGPYSSGYTNPSQKKGKVKVAIYLCNDIPQDLFQIKNNKYHLNFPKICEFKWDFTYDNEKTKITNFITVCKYIQENISSKKNNEFFFKKITIGNDKPKVYTGSGSVERYKNNFIKRLIEAIYNIKWKYFLPFYGDEQDTKDKFRYSSEEWESFKQIYYAYQNIHDEKETSLFKELNNAYELVNSAIVKMESLKENSMDNITKNPLLNAMLTLLSCNISTKAYRPLDKLVIEELFYKLKIKKEINNIEPKIVEAWAKNDGWALECARQLKIIFSDKKNMNKQNIGKFWDSHVVNQVKKFINREFI